MKQKIFLVLLFLSLSTLLFSQAEDAYLNTPKIIKDPSSIENYKAENRKFTGIPSLAITQSGRMWAVWFTGITPGEDLNNYVVVATSDNKGKTWKEVLVIDPDGTGPVRAYDPEIWMAPNGELWIFWTQAPDKNGAWSLIKEGTKAGVWTLKTENPDNEIPEFNTPTRLTDGVMIRKPIVLSTGDWALPVSNWKLEKENARLVVSSDNGKSWSIRGGASVPDNVRIFDEHNIVERKDGSLWMLIRTKYGIGESISKDRGYTWSPVIPSKIQHPSSRFFIYRLNSGNLLLVKHGPIDMRTRRSHLMAFISKDDGHSWSNGLLLDERPGVSYPDGQQTSDGNIYIIYDYNRTKDQNILMTSFKEEDILLGSDNKILETFTKRRVVSKGGK